jgi:ATP-binding cassette, subfamily A (ABC1), member 3
VQSHFGVGYLLVLEKEANASPDAIAQFITERVPVSAREPSVKAWAGRPRRTTGLTRVAWQQEAKLLSNVGAEMSFQMPLSSSGRFQPLFEALDSKLEALMVRTYGMSVTTLEEVFLKVRACLCAYLPAK